MNTADENHQKRRRHETKYLHLPYSSPQHFQIVGNFPPYRAQTGATVTAAPSSGPPTERKVVTLVIHQQSLYAAPLHTSAYSCFHGANWNNNNQDHSAGSGCDQCSDLTHFGPAELRFFPLEQRVVARGVDVLHPVLQVVGV